MVYIGITGNFQMAGLKVKKAILPGLFFIKYPVHELFEMSLNKP
jgi:hypothetical protein